jgi:hypothetical protein
MPSVSKRVPHSNATDSHIFKFPYPEDSSSIFDTSSPLETLEKEFTNLSNQFDLELPPQPFISARPLEAKVSTDILRKATLKRKHMKDQTLQQQP